MINLEIQIAIMTFVFVVSLMFFNLNSRFKNTSVVKKWIYTILISFIITFSINSIILFFKL